MSVEKHRCMKGRIFYHVSQIYSFEEQEGQKLENAFFFNFNISEVTTGHFVFFDSPLDYVGQTARL